MEIVGGIGQVRTFRIIMTDRALVALDTVVARILTIAFQPTKHGQYMRAEWCRYSALDFLVLHNVHENTTLGF